MLLCLKRYNSNQANQLKGKSRASLQMPRFYKAWSVTSSLSYPHTPPPARTPSTLAMAAPVPQESFSTNSSPPLRHDSPAHHQTPPAISVNPAAANNNRGRFNSILNHCIGIPNKQIVQKNDNIKCLVLSHILPQPLSLRYPIIVSSRCER